MLEFVPVVFTGAFFSLFRALREGMREDKEKEPEAAPVAKNPCLYDALDLLDYAHNVQGIPKAQIKKIFNAGVVVSSQDKAQKTQFFKYDNESKTLL